MPQNTETNAKAPFFFQLRLNDQVVGTEIVLQDAHMHKPFPSIIPSPPNNLMIYYISACPQKDGDSPQCDRFKPVCMEIKLRKTPKFGREEKRTGYWPLKRRKC